MMDLPASSRAALFALCLCGVDERGHYDDGDFRRLWNDLLSDMPIYRRTVWMRSPEGGVR